jgi:probable HAF family extracellular repeat protein
MLIPAGAWSREDNVVRRLARLGSGLALAAGLFLALAWSAHAEPMFMGLGDLPGGTFDSSSWAVSADGSTVVGESVSASGYEAFRWTSAGGMLGLGANVTEIAAGVSADGSTVVGGGSTPYSYSAFRWTSGGGLEYFGGDYSFASDVSADGSTVVGATVEAFVWTSEAGTVHLGALPGANFINEAWGISADGSTVVGWAFNASKDYEAFIWTSEGGMVGLGDLTGGSFNSKARAISADGSTVVGRGRSASRTEAFRWTSGGGMMGLGFYGDAWGVSADGSTIVGFGGEAVIWDSTHGVRELDTVLTDLGLDLSGWTLSSARDVSDDGRVIVGWGTNPSGQPEGWIAVLADPEVPQVPALSPGFQIALIALMAGLLVTGLCVWR